MKFGIISNTRMICDPINWDYSRFKSIITRYSGNPALLPLAQPSAAVQCGPLKVVPGVTVDTLAPASFGYSQAHSPWEITENALQRTVVWQPISDLETVQKQACDALAALRYAKEVGGTELADGTLVQTDRESRATFNEVYQSLKDGVIADTAWKDENTWFTPATTANLTPIFTAIAQHVRACFVAENALQTTINQAETPEDLRELDLPTEFTSAFATAFTTAYQSSL